MPCFRQIAMNNLTAQTSGKEYCSSISGSSPSPAPSSRRDWSRPSAAPAAARSPGVAPRANKASSLRSRSSMSVFRAMVRYSASSKLYCPSVDRTAIGPVSYVFARNTCMDRQISTRKFTRRAPPAQPRAATPPSDSFFVLVLAHAAQSSLPAKSQAFDSESHFESVPFQGCSVSLRQEGNRDQIRPVGRSPKLAART